MKYYCQYCGKDYKDVFTLTRAKCPHHPDGVFKGFHSLYEAEEKAVYTCKNCGNKEKTIRNLVVKKCPKSPKGIFKGNHEISKI